MFSECSMLMRNQAVHRKWADEANDEVGAAERFLAVLLSLVITGVVTVAMPLALLHLK